MELEKQTRWAGERSVDYLLETGLQIARERSSGGLSLSEMGSSYLDHPYARRHGAIRLADKTLVNEQGGAFRRGWFKDRSKTDADRGGAIVNDTQVADWLQKGTRTMLGRDIDGDITKRLEKHLPQAETVFKRELERGNQ